ncbi:MAG: DegV family protein, partial [Eubacteriales bacterium]|nr:DegV family protein [Eubacteriales bacterium]
MCQNRIAIITDSGCDLPDEMLREHGIPMLSLRILFRDGEYRDRIEITAEEVYARLDDEMPQTSLPHTKDVLDLLKNLAAQGYTDVIYVAISSGLSGTKNMVEMLSADFTQLRVHVYDSRALSFEQGYLVLEAVQGVRQGWDVATILKHLQTMREGILGMFVVRTLEYLKKGGRIGRVEGTLGQLLDIKPVIGLDENGVYYGLFKARGFQR